MEIITLFLFFVWTLKLIATFRAILWIRKHGETYRKELEKKPELTKSDNYKLFADCSGKFIPFGVKDFRLRQCAERTEKKTIKTYAAWVFQKVFFRLNRLIALTSVYLFLAASSTYLDRFIFFKEWHDWLLYPLAVVVLIINFLPFIEAIYSYAILGSYAVSFHMQTSDVTLLSELRVFIWKVVATVGSGATAFYVAYIKYGALRGDVGSIYKFNSSDWYNSLRIYGQCVYLTVTTFATVGYGDIVPQYGKGQLIAFLVEAQSFFLIIVVFSALTTSLGGQKTQTNQAAPVKDNQRGSS